MYEEAAAGGRDTRSLEIGDARAVSLPKHQIVRELCDNHPSHVLAPRLGLRRSSFPSFLRCAKGFCICQGRGVLRREATAFLRGTESFRWLVPEAPPEANAGESQGSCLEAVRGNAVCIFDESRVCQDYCKHPKIVFQLRSVRSCSLSGFLAIRQKNSTFVLFCKALEL